MADTFTPNYNLTKPQVGGDPDTWGGLLNGNFDTIDTQMKANYNLANAALPKSGGTITGNLAISGGTLNINRTSADYNALSLINTGGVQVQLDANGNSEGNLRTTTNHPLTFMTNNVLVLTLGTDKSATFASGATVGNGNSVGSSNTDVTKHLNLYGNAYGLGITGGRQNYVAPSGSIHAMIVGGSDILNVNGAGAILTGGLTVAGAVTSSQVFGSSIGAVVLGTSGSGGTVYLRPNGTGNATGQMTVNSSGVAQAADFQATSDVRLKTNVRPLRRGLDELKHMLPREYVKDGREEAGFLAQEVQDVLPEAVSENDEGYLTVSDRQVLALVASAVLDLDHRLTLAGV